jgi:hypothetical protein
MDAMSPARPGAIVGRSEKAERSDPTRGSPDRRPTDAREHCSGYQLRDYDVVDYQLYELAGTGLTFRGPPPRAIERGDYFTCIGAAQTFGCLCPTPYPTLLSAQLGPAVLNLGYGGAGPEFFARQPALLEYINRGRFAILQVMSGRSQSNSLFASGGLEYLTRRADGVRLGANEAYAELLAGPRSIRSLSLGPITRRLARLLASRRARGLAVETRVAWIESYRQLLAQITVPTVLFWFSQRSPDYVLRTSHLHGYFAEFPQLIDRPTLEAVKPLASCYVECVTRRGLPQRLVSRFTGEPTSVDPARDRPDLAVSQRWTHNRYYPSPEMQEDAAQSLLSAARALVASATRS